MNLPELSIKRHVLAIMLSAVITLFGLVSYNRIGVDEFPEIDFPMISITTTMIGADPDIIDTTVTNVIGGLNILLPDPPQVSLWSS
jgi:HAE1 family hydrophobic/amphiphilic exporter-1